MTKTLVIVRHAKSSWDEPGLDDFDRPLNHRGLKDAPKMGRRLRKGNLKPGRIVSSPAVRALHTCRLICEELKIPMSSIQEDELLYHAGADTILSVIKKTPDEVDTVMIVGHNPGLTDFVDSLCGEGPVNLPTASVTFIELPGDSWKNIRFGGGLLRSHDYPRKED
jgi:phosphohistidine phosphatase